MSLTHKAQIATPILEMFEVKVFEEVAHCPSALCHSRGMTMRYNGESYPVSDGNSMKMMRGYVHECPSCGKRKTYGNIYPRLVYKRL